MNASFFLFCLLVPVNLKYKLILILISWLGAMTKMNFEGVPWSKKSLGTTVLHPVKVSLLKPLRGLKAVLLGNVWAHVVQALFPDLYLPPNDPDSCPPQLLQQPPVLFRETSSAKSICMDCSSSFKKERGGWGVCHFRVDQKKRMCKWWQQEKKRSAV